MTPEEIGAEIAAYMAARAHEREAQAAAVLAAMTPREQAIAREAAVMGYVQGANFHAPGERFPPDSEILRYVVACCQDFPDLYPTLAAAQGERP